LFFEEGYLLFALQHLSPLREVYKKIFFSSTLKPRDVSLLKNRNENEVGEKFGGQI